MHRLISKIQYKNFEQGEFVEEQERTYEEVLQLIMDFPWPDQRKGIEIKLTAPSVTIENEKGQFLKFAPYFNGNFVLYFLDYSGRLYKRSYVRIEDHFPHIQAFFTEEGIKLSDFSIENTWLQHPEKNFITNDFNYRVTPYVGRKYLLSTTGVGLIFSALFITLLIAYRNELPTVAQLLLLVIIMTAGGGLNLILFFNYYFYASNKVFIMSRGNDIFYFGESGAPLQYDKKNIEVVIIHKVRGGGRNTLTLFVLFEIKFKDGISIKVPNIFAGDFQIRNKLHQFKTEKKWRFPLV